MTRIEGNLIPNFPNYKKKNSLWQSMPILIANLVIQGLILRDLSPTGFHNNDTGPSH